MQNSLLCLSIQALNLIKLEVDPRSNHEPVEGLVRNLDQADHFFDWIDLSDFVHQNGHPGLAKTLIPHREVFDPTRPAQHQIR